MKKIIAGGITAVTLASVAYFVGDEVQAEDRPQMHISIVDPQNYYTMTRVDVPGPYAEFDLTCATKARLNWPRAEQTVHTFRIPFGGNSDVSAELRKSVRLAIEKMSSSQANGERSYLVWVSLDQDQWWDNSTAFNFIPAGPVVYVSSK